MMNKPVIVVTLGEPGGIGADICLDLPVVDNCTLLLIGDIELLRSRAALLNKTVRLREIQFDTVLQQKIDQHLGEILVLHVACPIINTVGVLHAENAGYVLKLLDIAADLCSQGAVSAMVTAPVNKGIINKAGYNFSGHTEYLADKFACTKVVMLLANPLMKVALLTTHLPLKNVMAEVTQTNIQQTLQIIVSALRYYYKIDNPRIGVCGLNPHAGEDGYLGLEEVEVINPEIRRWQALGYNVSGAYPADTIFNALTDFDVILAMYHDQGLPVLKYSDFANGVNITLGLPILRLSVDHGTALSLAGRGLASSASLSYAIAQAVQLL